MKMIVTVPVEVELEVKEPGASLEKCVEDGRKIARAELVDLLLKANPRVPMKALAARSVRIET